MEIAMEIAMEMEIEEVGETASTGQRRKLEERTGGPVFPRRRRLSAAARQILEVPLETERVTAYDEIWFAGRPVT